jgi:hypothetical protein
MTMIAIRMLQPNTGGDRINHYKLAAHLARMGEIR